MDGIEFSVAAMRLIAKELQALTDEEKASLLDGSARLRLSVEDRSPARSSNAKSPNLDALNSVKQRLEVCETRDSATRLLEDEKLSKAGLQSLARMLDLPCQKSDTVDRLVEKIVEAVIGYKLRSKAIQGTSESPSSEGHEK
ncbi:hypothetical protein [Rosistilla oblonga]|uniref:hypothetical protein n=1 Tax=Rosistilla oblonga TaxID=2527990 RepID=UPI003A97E286